MPIQGELYPQPRGSSAAADAWRVLANRIRAEENQAGSGLEAARRGGRDFAGQAAGVEADGNKIADALSGARPGPEVSEIAGAAGNGAGAGHELSRAMGKANDPNTDAGQVDFEAANRAAGFQADGITRDAGNIRGYPDPPSGPGSGDPGRI